MLIDSQCEIQANDATTGYVKENAKLFFRPVVGATYALELDTFEFRSWKVDCWEVFD